MAIAAGELKKLIETLGPVCEEHGVHRIKVGDVEIEFDPPAPQKMKPLDAKMMDELSKRFAAGEPTDEETLLMSSPGYIPPELQRMMGKLPASLPPLPGAPPQVARQARQAAGRRR